MGKKARYLILPLFILFFLLLLAIIAFFYSGYRLNWQKGKIIAVGGLHIISQPADAQIWLNGEELPKTTPLLLNNLKPGKYSLKVKKDDYFSWKKNVEVEAKKTTLATGIVLFKKSTPQKIATLPDRKPDTASERLDFGMPILGWQWNKDKNKILAYNKNEIWLWDKNKDQKQLLLRQGTPILEAIWFNQDNYFIYSDSAGIKIFEIDERGKNNLYKIFNAPAKDLFLSKPYLYFKSGNFYYSLEIL